MRLGVDCREGIRIPTFAEAVARAPARFAGRQAIRSAHREGSGIGWGPVRPARPTGEPARAELETLARVGVRDSS